VAIDVLATGAVVAVPTDTVYGLAVDPTRSGATSALFELKGRPTAVELPVLVSGMDQAEVLAGPDGLGPVGRLLAAHFWPGGLTLVVPRRRGIDWDLGGDGTTIGLRCPDHDLVRGLCATVGPLAATSANRHGMPPLVTADAVCDEFGPELTVLDGGRCDGSPSTVVVVDGGEVRCLRAGAVAIEDVARVAAGER